METVRLLYRIGGDEKLSHRYFPGKPYTTDVLTDEQMAYIATQLPQPHATTGRPAYTNLELLPGILRVLRSGCRWRDLNLPGYHFYRLWSGSDCLGYAKKGAEGKMGKKHKIEFDQN
jgi:Putative transposase of IS4/5 family (DUF4096)